MIHWFIRPNSTETKPKRIFLLAASKELYGRKKNFPLDGTRFPRGDALHTKPVVNSNHSTPLARQTRNHKSGIIKSGCGF